jgi:hypothetical protein
MDESMRHDLARTLRECLTAELSASDRENVRALISNSDTSRATTGFVPGTFIMNVIDVTIFGETLLVGFDWPLTPGRTFVYAEDLEDLSEIGPESWAGILIAHLDETIGMGFEDQYELLKVGDLEVLVQDWE